MGRRPSRAKIPKLAPNGPEDAVETWAELSVQARDQAAFHAKLIVKTKPKAAYHTSMKGNNGNVPHSTRGTRSARSGTSRMTITGDVYPSVSAMLEL